MVKVLDGPSAQQANQIQLPQPEAPAMRAPANRPATTHKPVQAKNEAKGPADGVERKPAPPAAARKAKAQPTSAPHAIKPGAVATPGPARPVTSSTPIPNLPRGEVMVVHPGESLEHAIQAHFQSLGDTSYRVPPELVSLVHEMNQLTQGAPLPDRITMWDPQAILAYRTSRDLPADARTVIDANDVPVVLTPKVINDRLSDARELGDVVSTQAGDTWATFIDREYASLGLGAEAKTVLATMLKELNHTAGSGPLPPVVMKPSLRGLARVNGEYRNLLPGVGRLVNLEAKTIERAKEAGCDPTRMASEPTPGQAYHSLPDEKLLDVTAFAYREQLSAALARSPADAENDLRDMTWVVDNLNGGRKAPMLFPSSERMAELLLIRRRDRTTATKAETAPVTATATATDAVPESGEHAAAQSDHDDSATATHLHPHVQALLQRVIAMKTWTPPLSAAQQDTATTEIANAIYKSRRFEAAWFPPLALDSSTSLVGDGLKLGTPGLRLSPTAEAPLLSSNYGLSLGTDGLSGPWYAPVPFMGISWADIDASSMHREAMGGQPATSLDPLAQALAGSAGRTPQQNAAAISIMSDIASMRSELQSVTVNDRPLVSGGYLTLTREPSESFSEALARVCGGKVSPEHLQRVGEALDRYYGDSGMLVANQELTSLVGDAASHWSFTGEVTDRKNLAQLDYMLHEADMIAYVEPPYADPTEPPPYDQPERMEAYVYKELKRRGIDRSDLSPRQAEDIREAAKSFVAQIQQIKQGAADFASRLNAETVQLNRDLARILESAPKSAAPGAAAAVAPRHLSAPARPASR